VKRAVVLSVAAAAWLAHARGSAAEERIALLPLDLGGDLGASRPDVEAAVARGLAIAGRAVMSPDDAAARARTAQAEIECRTPACWGRVGAVTEAAYLVGGSVGRAGGSFHVKFQLVRAADGSTLATEENECEVADCSVAELARLSARELVRQTLGPVPAAATSATAAAPHSGDERREGTRAWWPPVAVGVGVASIAGGVFLLKLHGDCVQSVAPGEACRDKYSTLPWGLITVGTGAALATLGVVYLVRDVAGRPVVSLAPAVGAGALGVAGRF